MTASVCRRCESPLEPEDLRCAVCALPAPSLPVEAGVSEVVAQILRCHGCGAAVRYSAEVGAPRCDFCGSVMELETPEDPVEQAERFVPFCVSEAEAREALQAWLGGLGFFRPRDLQARAAVDGLKPLWWVGWMFEAEATVCWAADSNEGSGRSAWAPHSGRFDMTVRNVVVPASVGLHDDECRELVEDYDLRRVDDAPRGYEGATVEQFTVQRSAVRQIIARALEGEAQTRCIPHIPGSRHRNVRVSVLPARLGSTHYAFPAYVLAYRYEDKLYRAIVHGQNPDCVLGDAPLSWGRIVGVALGVLALVAMIIAMLTSV